MMSISVLSVSGVTNWFVGVWWWLTLVLFQPATKKIIGFEICFVQPTKYTYLLSAGIFDIADLTQPTWICKLLTNNVHGSSQKTGFSSLDTEYGNIA